MAPLRLSVASFLLAATTLAIDIPATPVWPSGQCTDKSLSIPSWVIQDYEVASGTATFQVANRAHDFDGIPFITCSPGHEQCQSSAAGTQLHVTWTQGKDGKTVIGFSEFWSCNDEGTALIFTATGNTTITACVGSDCKSAITYLAPGTLSNPVPLTPAQPSPPPGYTAPTCADVGKNQWTLSSVEFKNYTKGQCKQWYEVDRACLDNNDSANFINRGQYLSLNVTNNAISHEVLCSFTPSWNNNNLPSPLRCTGGDFNEITLDVTLSGTAPNFTVKVEELWYCLENPKTNVNATVIVASGTVATPLTCESHTGITGASDDIVTLCTDPATSHSIDGAQTAKQSLPAYVLQTAYPTHGGCTYDSLVNPTFYYRGMYFVTNPFPPSDPDSATISKFTAGLTGPGFADYFFYENKAISGSGVNTVYTCAVYYDGKPKDQHWNCTYSFNPTTKTITQDKVWQCEDKNAAQPLYFDGSGSFNWGIDPNSDCYTNSNALTCSWNDDGAVLQPGLPYPIPKVTVSLINVLPPDLGEPTS